VWLSCCHLRPRRLLVRFAHRRGGDRRLLPAFLQ